MGLKISWKLCFIAEFLCKFRGNFVTSVVYGNEFPRIFNRGNGSGMNLISIETGWNGMKIENHYRAGL